MSNKNELEAMTADRDYWRTLALEQQETIENQQRNIERMGMWEGAFAGGVRSEMDKAIEQLQIERDRYKAELNKMKGHLMGFHDAFGEQSHSKQERNTALKSVLSSKRTGDLPYILREWFRLPDLLDKYLPAQLKLSESVESALIALDNFDSKPILHRMTNLSTEIGLLDSSYIIYAFINGLFEKQQIVVYFILGELETNESVTEHTVSRLDIRWAKKNIHPTIKSHKYLFEALNHAYKWKISGDVQDDYAGRNFISIAALQKYATILKAVEQASQRIDPNVQELLPKY